MSFPLSDQPVFGEWLIFVEVQGHTYNKSFEVQKYGEAFTGRIKSTVYQDFCQLNFVPDSENSHCFLLSSRSSAKRNIKHVLQKH